MSQDQLTDITDDITDAVASLDVSPPKKHKKKHKKHKKSKKKNKVKEEEQEPEYWIELLCARQVWGYMLPPRKSFGGLFAKQWDLPNPDWNGILRVKAKDNNLKLEFQNRDTSHFAQSVIIRLDKCAGSNGISHFIEPVHDSSRYFAVAIKDPVSGRTAQFGFGFQSGTTHAFDMSAAINDQLRMVQRHLSTDERATQEKETKFSLPAPEGFASQDDDNDHSNAIHALPIALHALPIVIKPLAAPVKLDMTCLQAKDKKKKKKKKKKHREATPPSTEGSPSSSSSSSSSSFSSSSSTPSPSIPAPANDDGFGDDWGDFASFT